MIASRLVIHPSERYVDALLGAGYDLRGARWVSTAKGVRVTLKGGRVIAVRSVGRDVETEEV